MHMLYIYTHSVHLTDNNIFFGYIVCWEMHCRLCVTAYHRFVNQSYLVPKNITPSVWMGKVLTSCSRRSLLLFDTLSLMLDHVPYIQYLTVSQKVCKALMKLIWISLLLICIVFSSFQPKKIE